MQITRENFCETKVISVCNANEKSMQKQCSFYGKSSYGEQCMFLHFEQFCDNLEAQKQGYNFRSE